MSYERQIGRSYGRGCWMMFGVSFVGGLLGLAMVVTTLLVLGGTEARPGTWRIYVAPLVPLPFMALIALTAWAVVRRRNRRFDRAFASLGLTGRQVGGVLRGWHGTLRGRAFDAWLRKGPTLELYLGCVTGTRGGVTRAGPLLRRFAATFSHLEPLDPAPPEVPDCTVYAENEEWMRRWLARPELRSSLDRLMEPTRRVAPVLRISPDAVQYVRAFLPVAEVTAENLTAWLDDLETLAVTVDRVGPASPAAEPTRLETWGRTERGRSWLPKLFGCMGLVLLLVFGALYLLLILEHG